MKNKKTNNDFFKDVSAIAEQMKGLADTALPTYMAFADDVDCGRITNIKTIEYNLDYMLDFCWDDRILSLYKRVLRKIYEKHPDTVESYVYAYRDMYVEEEPTP